MTHEAPDPRFRGVLLVGGRSRRMGTDKLRLVLPDGALLVERAADALRTRCGGGLALVAPADVEPPPLDGFERLHDVAPGEGPLAGLLAALEDESPAPWLLVLAGDQPAVDPGFLRAFQRAALEAPDRVLLPLRGRSRVEPLPMAVPKALAPVVRDRYEAGERALRRALPSALRRTFAVAAAHGRPWHDLDTPDEWRAWTGGRPVAP